METVMDWAVNRGHLHYNPAGRSLLKSLPRINREPDHHPALHYSQVGLGAGQSA